MKVRESSDRSLLSRSLSIALSLSFPQADALIVSDCVFDSLSWNNLQQWAQEAWRKKYEVTHSSCSYTHLGKYVFGFY